MDYTIQTEVTGDFDDVVETTMGALEAEGFGVLTDIDVAATMQEKLGESFRQYRILGACQPPLAHEALTEELDLGALLPCNVIVYETDDSSVVVSAVDPGQLFSLADNETLEGLATDVTKDLERALETVETQTESEPAA